MKCYKMINYCFIMQFVVISFEHGLEFGILQDSERIGRTNKGKDSIKISWYNDNIRFHAMLMFVLFVDNKHYVRVFDVDTND